MKNSCSFYLLLLGWLYTATAVGQVNFFGKPGYIGIPSADWETKPLGFSFAYLPREYSLFQSPGNKNTLNLYNVRLGFTSFMEVNLSIAYRPLLADQIGIGDRQLDFRFGILKETDILPALVFGWTPPGSVTPVMSHDYLVATKNLDTGIGTLGISAGYGSPYVLRKRSGNTNFFQLQFRKKDEFLHGNYLSGFFWGANYAPVSFGGLLMEYDTRTFNFGAYLKLWDRIYLQGYSYEGKELAFQIATNFNLDFAPRILRKYEKDLD